MRWAAREADARGRDLLIVLAHTGVDPALMADPLLWRTYRDDLLVPDAPVVVGVDGSPASRAAITYAVDAAAAASCPLIAVHTWWDLRPAPEPEHPLDGGAIPRGEHGVLTAHLAGPSAAHPEVAITSVVERAHPAQALLEHARGARMAVVGTRGRGGFAGLLLGSVSRTLVHKASCPVAVVPPVESPTRPCRSAAASGSRRSRGLPG